VSASLVLSNYTGVFTVAVQSQSSLAIFSGAAQVLPAGPYWVLTTRDGVNWSAWGSVVFEDFHYYNLTVSTEAVGEVQEGDVVVFEDVTPPPPPPPAGHESVSPTGGTTNSGSGNMQEAPQRNAEFKHMKSNGTISLVEAKTSADMLAYGQSLVAPTVKTGELLSLAKTAAQRAEIDNPALVILDYRAQANIVRASLIERAPANAVAVDALRDAVIAGFLASGESIRASYTLEAQLDGTYKLPGFFTPHDLAAEADPLVAIMNAAFVAQQSLEYQRAVPTEDDANATETVLSTRKKFTPDSIIARAISLADKDARFANILGLVVVVDENSKKVHVLFIKAPAEGQAAYDVRAEALPAGASAITLDVEVPAEAAAEAGPSFTFFA